MIGRLLLCAAIGTGAVLLPGSLVPAPAQDGAKVTSPGTVKRPGKRPKIVVRRSRGYGFLPGYTPPDLRGRPDKTYHYWYGRDWDGFPVGSYGTGGYGGMWYRGRFSNGLGPCWSRTPIGPMWNCG